MRRAVLRQGRRFLMQTDLTKPAPSIIDSHPGVKRTFSQQTSPTFQSNPTFSSKVPRVDFAAASQAFSASRRSSQTGSKEGMPQANRQGPGRSSKKQNFYGAKAPSSAGEGSSRFPGGSLKRGKGKGQTSFIVVVSGPVRDEAYIAQEFKKSPLSLKEAHLSEPKSALGNFSMVSVGSRPEYTSKEVLIDQPGGKKLRVWRCV